jgi:hypothetical protein
VSADNTDANSGVYDQILAGSDNPVLGLSGRSDNKMITELAISEQGGDNASAT